MFNLEEELDRYLLLLRNKIRQQGFIQMNIQNELGWGRSYISQLLTKQKALRMDQLLSILEVIEVDAQTFFTELHDLPHGEGQSRGAAGAEFPPAAWGEGVRQELEDMTNLLQGLCDLLITKELFAPKELWVAIKAAEAE